MGDLTTLAKARRELEELYLGVPDESVNLTFEDLAEVTKNVVPQPEKRKAISIESIPEGKSKREGPSPLNKIPSLDFNRGLQAAKSSPPPHHQHSPSHRSSLALSLPMTALAALPYLDTQHNTPYLLLFLYTCSINFVKLGLSVSTVHS